MVRPDGIVVYVHAKGELTVNEQGEVTRVLGTVIDITDQKIIENELKKHREHLEELVNERTRELRNTQEELVKKERLATLGQLTAMVSHELRNPLGAIRPSLYTIQQSIDTKDEKISNALDRVKRNVERCDRIIEELLDFTRTSKPSIENIDVCNWLNDVIEEYILPENILLKTDYKCEQSKLKFDASRLERAIINVLQNAEHALIANDKPDNQKNEMTILVATRVVNNRYEIIIKDNGVGISEEKLSKIFEPLFSTKSFGVGLGMVVVKQTMEQHGGGVQIESQAKSGSTVTLWLPIIKDSDVAA